MDYVPATLADLAAQGLALDTILDFGRQVPMRGRRARVWVVHQDIKTSM